MRVRLLLVMALLFPAWLHAQSIRGVVVDQGGLPVSGVVVLLLDSASAESARALSNEAGEFRLATARGGAYRLRTMRIGFRPFTSPSFTLRAGQNDVQRVVLSNVQLSLDTVKVLAKNVCRVDRDSAASTFAVWEQVRTALQATQLTGTSRAVTTTTLAYERTLDRMGRSVLSQSSTVATHPAAQPWHSLSADSLRRGGYVVNNGAEATIYYAPSLEVLLSDVFLEDHCFHLKTGKDKSQLGIVFEPASTRKKTAELSGTLWLDRASAQLRKLEFRYENILPEQQAESGGEMEFAAMRNGTWAIARWNIRMPELERAIRAQSMGGDQLVIAKIQVSGGELALAVHDVDTLWSRPPLVLTGDIVDSVSNKSIAGAIALLSGTALQGATDSKGHFTIAGVLPGEYTLEVHTPSLDSVSAAHQSALTFTDGKTPAHVRVPSATQILATLCGLEPLEAPGIIAGTVAQRGDTTVPASLRVVAEWMDGATSTGSDSTKLHSRWKVVRPGRRGGYRLCGVPLNTDIVLQIETEGSNSGNVEPVKVRLADGKRFARADLTLDRSMVRGAVLAGFVFGDTTRQPLADAEVLLPDINKRVVTNQRGEFRLRDIPAGTHRVVVRRIGFGPVDVPIAFASNETVDRRIFLSRVTVIDSVVITANRPEPWRDIFDENRKLGFGQFLTREELAKKEMQSMSSVMQELRGIDVRPGTSGHAWVGTSRNVSDWYVPKADIDWWHGAKPACYADVFVDNDPIFTGKPRQQLFDLSEIAPSQIEAIEYYADPTKVPPRYLTGRNCGTLVIHLRHGN